MKQHGFTILEVLLALAITALALGGIMSLSAGSKRLAFKAEESLNEILFLRAALNIGALQRKSDYPKYPVEYAEKITINLSTLIDKVPRQTQRIKYALETYQLEEKQPNGKSEILLDGVRWKLLETAR
jgi:prepilin-type N-terminal cleavage/methylation domain-containing protein